MSTEYTIVVPDSEVLSCICGINDNNLKLIEEHLGIPVYTKGNEISVETEDEPIRRQFQFIVDRIADEVNDGSKNYYDIVASVLNVEKKPNMESLSILVPGSQKRIYPRTENQALYVEAMRKNELVFCAGSAGTGKTFLAVAQALSLLLSHKVSKLVLTRPVVEAGESLGFLPGALEEKISPYLKPLFDAMESIISCESVKRLLDSGIIETAPLAYMRGRTLNNCAIVLDEAQNTTQEQMKMFLTRLGENSRMFITGDITQIDLPKKIRSGLVQAIELLDGVDGISVIRLTSQDVVRNPLVRKILKVYENEETKN